MFGDHNPIIQCGRGKNKNKQNENDFLSQQEINALRE